MKTWLSTTTELLRKSSLSLSDVAEGAGVELRWLYKFKDGCFSDPGVLKVQRIHDFLTKQGGNVMESPEHGTECQETTVEAGAVQFEHVPEHSQAA